MCLVGVKPVVIELTDFKTKEKVDELEVDAVLVATGRAPFTQVNLILPSSPHLLAWQCPFGVRTATKGKQGIHVWWLHS